MRMIGLAAGRAGARSHSAGARRRANAARCPVPPLLLTRPLRRRVVVCVDSSPGSAEAFARAAAQARQRGAVLDVVFVIPDDADDRAVTMARVRLGEFTRRVCPYGVGAQTRLNIERGDPEAVLSTLGTGAEMLITGHAGGPGR